MVDYKKRFFKFYSEKNILLALSKKELKAKYSGSKLGIWWAIILPLLLALSINLIFTKVFNVAIPNYTLFVLSAIMPWLFFSQGLTEATNSFLANTSILKQGVFPREFVPLSSVLGNFLNFIIGLGVILPLFLLFNSRAILFIPLLILSLISFFLFICGFSLILSSINVFYRDISYFLSFGLMIWFWITPIFYSLEMVPYPYSIICLINPLTYFILNFRELLYYGRVDFLILSVSIVLSIVFFSAGYYIFLCKERKLLKRL